MAESNTKPKPCNLCKAPKGAVIPFFVRTVKLENDFRTKQVQEFICTPCSSDINHRLRQTIQDILPVALRENMFHQVRSMPTQ